MKELLRITNIKEDICEVNCEMDCQEDEETLSAAILGVMCQDERVADAINAASDCYRQNTEEAQRVVREASMEIKCSSVAS